MRTESELQATRDRYNYRALSSGSLGDHLLSQLLEWVCDPLVSDLELDDIRMRINGEAWR